MKPSAAAVLWISLTADERKAALDHLIDQELLREQLHAPDSSMPRPEEVAQRVAEIRKQYPEAETNRAGRLCSTATVSAKKISRAGSPRRTRLDASGRFPPASRGQHRQQKHRELLQAGTSAATSPVGRTKRSAGGSVSENQRTSYPEENHSTLTAWLQNLRAGSQIRSEALMAVPGAGDNE